MTDKTPRELLIEKLGTVTIDVTEEEDGEVSVVTLRDVLRGYFYSEMDCMPGDERLARMTNQALDRIASAVQEMER